VSHVLGYLTKLYLVPKLVTLNGKLITNYSSPSTASFLDSADVKRTNELCCWPDFPGGSSDSSAECTGCSLCMEGSGCDLLCGVCFERLKNFINLRMVKSSGRYLNS
jgi:hypothetical protein